MKLRNKNSDFKLPSVIRRHICKEDRNIYNFGAIVANMKGKLEYPVLHTLEIKNEIKKLGFSKDVLNYQFYTHKIGVDRSKYMQQLKSVDPLEAKLVGFEFRIAEQYGIRILSTKNRHIPSLEDVPIAVVNVYQGDRLVGVMRHYDIAYLPQICKYKCTSPHYDEDDYEDERQVYQRFMELGMPFQGYDRDTHPFFSGRAIPDVPLINGSFRTRKEIQDWSVTPFGQRFFTLGEKWADTTLLLSDTPSERHLWTALFFPCEFVTNGGSYLKMDITKHPYNIDKCKTFGNYCWDKRLESSKYRYQVVFGNKAGSRVHENIAYINAARQAFEHKKYWTMHDGGEEGFFHNTPIINWNLENCVRVRQSNNLIKSINTRGGI